MIISSAAHGWGYVIGALSVPDTTMPPEASTSKIKLDKL
jgi:hypothetical protein